MPDPEIREWQSLPDIFQRHAVSRSDHPALSFVNYSHDPDGEWQTLTFAEVDLRVRALAAALEASFPRGSRVAVLCPQSTAYSLALLSCMYARMIAVPLFPPEDPRRRSQLEGMLADAQPACLLTTRPQTAACQELAEGRVPVWVVEENDPSRAPQWSGLTPAPQDPAYLQYTSGSTGSPRGAVISHANLMTSTRQVIEGCGLSSGTPIASWLPLFHDMGLSIGVLAPAVAGTHLALMSPLAFIQRPLRWLRLLDAHRAHFSGGPNFAYDLCVRKAPAPTGLDLGSVRVLTNGAEPVRVDTLRRFTDTYAASGLAPDTVKPSYGLAEATVLVACNRVGQRWTELTLDSHQLTAGRVRILPADEAATDWPTAVVVGCGRPVGQEVRIADPETGVEQTGGYTGELWVRGPNVAAGYWRQSQPTAHFFGRTLKTAEGSEPGWLRTGDVGFLHDGEVFVLGRTKDVIIIHGANHAAADIEDTVRRAIPEAVPAGVAAFSVPGDDGDQLIVMVELTAGPNTAQDIALRRRVQRAVAEHHGVRPRTVIAAKRGSLPRTTSGKLRRGDCRARYLADQPTLPTPTDTQESL
ncbi:fatty acyl-AMP ligase [Streptomyces sp. NBC_01244]|uniref:fatty acyl-AMP ligase n=1 Tax=Streptomyces sp. NBC_01244 TaxID=2903797 RepID=UPI002E1339C6|nr:fatty acyl-AMP ligase [Streptomyces sp. NBC_01244]